MPITVRVCHHTPRVARTPAYSNEPVCALRSHPAHDKRVYNASGFIQCVCEAYNHHHRLIVRPDDVWIAIVTQLGLHLEQPKASIFNVASFDVKPIIELAKQPWMLPTFSTTTELDVLACTLACYNERIHNPTLSDPFDLLCGIPEITLLGNVQDWIALRQKANGIERFETAHGRMRHWSRILFPVLDEFVHAFSGTPNQSFWNRVCSFYGGGSSVKYLSGWITTFCVFDVRGNWNGHELSKESENVPGTFFKSPWPIVPTDYIPLGYNTIRIHVDRSPYFLYCGHRSYSVVDDTSLQPNVEWAFVENINI